MRVTKTKCLVLTNLGLGDNIFCNGIVRYLCTFYEKTFVVVKSHNVSSVTDLYCDLSNVYLYVVNNDNEISVNFGYDRTQYKRLEEEYDIHTCGAHLRNGKTSNNSLFPLNFFDDLSIPRQYFWTKSVIPRTSASRLLREFIADTPYIFIQNQTSIGSLFDILKALDYFKINKNEILIVHPLQNIYSKNEPFYVKAEACTNQISILSFVDIIENSQLNLLTDSSIFCLANFLNIKHTKNYVCARRKVVYNHLYDQNTYLPDTNININTIFYEVTL